ncbi:Phage protein [Devosia sp. DBB001]|nr:Phage protein [Devosia sp. DBB001]
MRDLANHLSVKRAISPAAAVADNTPIVSQIVDLYGYGQAMFAIAIGALADADATFAVLIEHGDTANLSDAAAVPDSQLTGTEADAAFGADDDNETRKIGYVGPKRYLRLTITPSGNAGNAFVAAVAVMGSPRYWPAA